MRTTAHAWGSRVAELFRPRRPKLVGVERVMHWLAMAGCIFFALVAMWESFGPPRGGHFAASAAYAISGENMVHWRKFAVVNAYMSRVARPDEFYCHHPYGVTVLQGLSYLVFGHHWFSVKAAAIGCSIVSPPLLYGIGRRAWGVIPGAVAALVFVFIPIDLSFADFANLEVPTIAFGLLFMWGTAGVWATSETRYLVLAALGALGTCNGEWEGLLLVGWVGIFGFFRAYVLPRTWYGRVDDRMYARWFALATAMAVGTLLLYLVLFAKADKIADFMGSYHMRSSGDEEPVKEVFTLKRKLWLATTFTPISYGVLAVGVPLALVKLVRKPLEIFPVAWALTASFHYFVFKQAADIHIFWSHYFAPAVALAAGTATDTFLAARTTLVAWLQRTWDRPSRSRFAGYATAAVVGALVAVPLLLLARVAVPELVQSRKTAGRFDENGKYIGSDGDMPQFARWAVSNVATAGSTLQALERYDFNFSSEYSIDRPYIRVSSLTVAQPEDPQRIAVVDTRNQPVKQLETIAKQFGVQAVGPFWRVDRAQKGPALTALQYREREPNPFEWYFISGTDLIRTISRNEDPYATWEWRDALGLPNSDPGGTPGTADERRVAHNVAVADGDTARADELSAVLSKEVGTPMRRDYTGGIHLLGVDVQRGPAIVVTLFWETDKTYKRPDVTYQVKCKIVAPPRLWPTQTDYFEKDMAPVPVIRPAMWKPGYLYAQRFIALHRIGREECRGGFTGEVHLVDGGPNPLLFTLD
jgi:hypothetical protein